MTYDPYRPGIPTLYNGIQFRSRLEAKWAAFFDLLGWEYEYEPFDLNGWIPDFLIKGKPQDVLVEVKPVTEFPADVAAEVWNACPKQAFRDDLDCMESDYQLLIVGSSIAVKEDENGESFGWTISIGSVENETWDLAVLGRWDNSPGIGFHESGGSYRDVISGEYDGGEHKGGTVDRGYALSLWREAGNLTQWKGKRQTNERARRRPIPALTDVVPSMTREEMIAASVARDKARDAERRQAAERAYADGSPIVASDLDPLDVELIRIIVNEPKLTATAAAKIDVSDLRDTTNRVILEAAYAVVAQNRHATLSEIQAGIASEALRRFVSELIYYSATSWESRLDGVFAGYEERRRKDRIRQLENDLRKAANDPEASPEHRRLLLEEYLSLTTNRPGKKVGV